MATNGTSPSPQPAVAAAAPPAPAPAGGGGAEAAGKFPLGVPPKLSEMPFNPFLNNSKPLSDPVQILKSILMLPIFLLRLLLLLSCFFIATVWTSLVLIGAKDTLSRPFPKWRRNLLWPVQFLARIVLFSLGYNWIEVRGKPAARERAPILICNHVTFVDPVFVFMAHLPVIVTAKENLSIPCVGTVMRALQVVCVDRISPTSRKDAAAEIKKKALCNDWSRIALFPEATTTNGRSLVSFKAGAFAPGVPIQPIVVTYPHTSLDPAWVAEGMASHVLLFRVMTQLHNRMRVQYLDVIDPTPLEKKDPKLFAERARMVMARALNIAVTEHSFGDVALALEALKLKMPTGVGVIEFGRIEKLFHLDVREAKEFLRRFNEMDTTGSGLLSFSHFAAALHLPPSSPITRQVFDLFDSEGKGVINFRQFVAGLAFISKHAQFRDAVEAAFALFDRDRDGVLGVEEAILSFRELIPGISDDEVQGFVSTIGLDKKDSLTWHEFSNFLLKRPEYLAAILAARPTLLADSMNKKLS